MKKITLIILAVLLSVSGFSQNKPAYKLFNAKGKKVSYKKMLKQLAKADVVFLAKSTTTLLPIG